MVSLPPAVADLLRVIVIIESELDELGQEVLTKQMVEIVTEIIEYMGHLLRKANLGEFGADVVDLFDKFPALTRSSFYMIGDYAMKFLPRKFLDQQRDFFGKVCALFCASVSLDRRLTVA